MSGPVDRQTTVPFHLKLFYRVGGFHGLDEFHPPPSVTSNSSNNLPSQHVQIYTWPTCSLQELSQLLASAVASTMPDPSIGTRLAYRLIYPDTRGAVAANAAAGDGRYISKELGSVVLGSEGSSGPDADLSGEPTKTLQDARFVIGDYISCAILPAAEDGSVAAAPPPPQSGSLMRGRGGMGNYSGDFPGGRGGVLGGPRENGFGGFRVRGRGGPPSGPGLGAGGVPSGEWRRGERIPDGPGGQRYARRRGGY